MSSMIILRHIRFRPASCVGMQASGTTPSMTSGYRSAQSQLCMQPIDVPITSTMWFTCSPSVTSRYWAATMSP